VKPVAYKIYEPELLNGINIDNIYRAGSRDPQRLMYLLGIRKVSDKTIVKGKKISDRFFPDPKIGWVKRAVKLGRILSENKKYCCIISTSPPMSTHLVAGQLSDEFNIPWIADFRDFWTSYKAEDWFDNKKQIEKALLLLQEITGKASAVTVVNPAIKEYLNIGQVIYNSYDEDRAKLWRTPSVSDKFIIGILGTIDDLCPIEPLFKLLLKLKEKNPELMKKIKLQQVGRVMADEFYAMLDKYNLDITCELHHHQKREDTIRLLNDTSSLYIALSSEFGKGIMPGRMFDLLASGRPILASVPTGSVVGHLVDESGNGICYNDDDSLVCAVEYLYRQINLFSQNKLIIQPLPEYAHKYSSQKMVEKFADIINQLI
ncbi:MAG: hypothetical protein ACE5D6_10305, partial [Candidatus Zixiibacteriota bacterium]